jgi:alginate O-acetyltransferase complex protein AlgJ
MRSPDALSLPAVPPPAPGYRPRDLLVAIGFCLALALPAIATLVLPARDALEFENRMSANWPSLSASSSWHEFTGAFEKAFGDRFAGRSALVRAHHALKAVGFRTSPVPNVMIARDGWLYWLGEDGRSLDRHYRGTLPYPDADVDAMVRELRRRQAYLAQKGIAYVVAIVPEKFTIYPEFVAPWIRRMERTPLDRVADAIRADGTIRFVDLRPALREAKARDRLYHRTDSHWNLLGALVGYEEIMKAVAAALPPDRRPDNVYAPKRPRHDAGSDWYSGDLSRMLGLPRLFREQDLAPLERMLTDTAAERCAKRVSATEGPRGSGARERYECPGRRGRLLMLRDSMAIPIVPLIAENFGSSLFVSDRRLDPGDVEAERPDVVVEEMVERTMNMTAARPMP